MSITIRQGTFTLGALPCNVESDMTELPDGYVPVLDKGYVGLVDWMGSDVTPADRARVSFKKSARDYTDEQNNRLTNYLLKNKEYSCLRHNVFTFEIRMPVMIARQLWKYIVASNFTQDQLGWNENSRRYITDVDEDEYYIPSKFEWRSAPENKKQGSGDNLDSDVGHIMTALLMDHVERSQKLYETALENGVATEQARLFLPANGLYVTAVWTTSLNALLHVLEERLDGHAQKEIRDYAEALRVHLEKVLPVTYKAWKDNLGDVKWDSSEIS